MRAILLMTLLSLALGAQTFDFAVQRVRALRDQPGRLHIDAGQVLFQSADGKTTLVIRMEDLRTASVADPRNLRFQVFEVRKWKPFERHEYTFRSSSDAPLDALGQFLSSRVPRPVVGHYWNGAEFEAPAYHRTKLSGSNGTLRIGTESIQYLSDKQTDARTWLYRDIETIGRPDAFRFRVTTSRETYVLELKETLPDAAYELAWTHVYRTEPPLRP